MKHLRTFRDENGRTGKGQLNKYSGEMYHPEDKKKGENQHSKDMGEEAGGGDST